MMGRHQRQTIRCGVCDANLTLDEKITVLDIGLSWSALMAAAAPLTFGHSLVWLITGLVSLGFVYRWAPWHGLRYRLNELPHDESATLPVAKLVSGLVESSCLLATNPFAVELPPGAGPEPGVVPIARMLGCQPETKSLPVAKIVSSESSSPPEGAECTTMGPLSPG